MCFLLEIRLWMEIASRYSDAPVIGEPHYTTPYTYVQNTVFLTGTSSPCSMGHLHLLRLAGRLQHNSRRRRCSLQWIAGIRGRAALVEMSIKQLFDHVKEIAQLKRFRNPNELALFKLAARHARPGSH
jgi:hypothetical protein